jgi:hypothetical protein
MFRQDMVIGTRRVKPIESSKKVRWYSLVSECQRGNTADDSLFRGRAMTYYERWAYKFAARDRSRGPSTM